MVFTVRLSGMVPVLRLVILVYITSNRDIFVSYRLFMYFNQHTGVNKEVSLCPFIL